MRVSNNNTNNNIGMTSITEQDWEDLMNNIDSYMESARKIREQEHEYEEESLESKIYNKIYMRLHNGQDKQH